MLPPDPIEAIKFRMGQMGLEKSDVGGILGGGNDEMLTHCLPH